MMWQVLYWLLVGCGAMAFAWKLRVTIWWVAFFSSVVYGLPVAFGRDLFGHQLTTETNIALLLVMATTFAIALYSKPRIVPEIDTRKSTFLTIVASTANLVAFAAIIAVHGVAIFFLHKTESGIGGYFYILWRLAATFGFLACILTKRYSWAVVAAIPLVGSLFAGDRTAVAMTAIATIWGTFHELRLSKPKALAATLGMFVIGVALFFGKPFQGQWATGTFEGVGAYLNLLEQQGESAITKAEPFATAGVMNALTTFDRSPPEPLLLEVAAQFLIVPSKFGFESTSFNDFYQPILFPKYREGSLAYSYWGEALLRGGWFGFGAFLLVYLVILWCCDRLTVNRRFIVRLIAYVGGSYWAFYIHRNSMVSIVAYERQIIIYALILALSALLLRAMNRRVTR